MSTIDALVSLALCFTAALFMVINWYPQAVFTVLVFIWLQVNLILHGLIQPLPRVLVNGVLVDDPEKIKKIDKALEE